MEFNNFCVFIAFLVTLVNSSAIDNSGDVDGQGLYSKSDHVMILTRGNFERKVYGQKTAMMIQFYNTYCGHCRAFAPKFKIAAADIIVWKNIVQLAVMDCSEEENNEICREFEVMAYPSLRYLHENYVKANRNFGDLLFPPDSAEKFKTELITKLQSEQSLGRLQFAPLFKIASYDTYSNAMRNVPKDVIYTFIVFESENSTIGSEIALDINDYEHIKVKRIYDTSELAITGGVRRFPGLVVVDSKLEATQLTPNIPSKDNLLYTINKFLQTKSYEFPIRDHMDTNTNINSIHHDKITASVVDLVYYSDLEKTIKTSLHTEITRRKNLNGEPLQALMDYLDVLISSFPFRGNLKDFITDLRSTLATKNEWGGEEVYELVKRLETVHSPVYSQNLEYISCKGSQPKYRGYTCGLWTLFHTLTVNAAQLSGSQGPKVLKAMHGYVKNFFGCTECAGHFQAMAARNRLFDVKDNDRAVLWLWISHNEVNLRLAGDVTEDPQFPKIQFPSVAKCPECRLARGAWNLPAVYEYLQRVYGMDNIRDTRRARSAVAVPSFSNLDIGMLSLLYILSFVILIVVVKLFLTKRYYRKRAYKHGRGKV